MNALPDGVAGVAMADQLSSSSRPTGLGVAAGTFVPLRLQSAGEQVAERLVTALALGEFVPGQRLPTERDLAATLGVSRTTIREAISRLSALGYVGVRRGRLGGAFVQSGPGPEADEMIRRTLIPNWGQLEDLFDFRTLIEPLIARTAAVRRTAEDAARIRELLEAYRGAGSDRTASSDADRALHGAIAAAAHNPYLSDLSARIRQGVSLGFGAEPYSAAIRERAILDHGELASAVIAGTADRAAAIAARHFTITEASLRELHDRTRDVAGRAVP